MTNDTPGIIRPPDEFYERPDITTPTNQTIDAQHNITYLTERIEATANGILKYNKGMLFPEKGWITPETMWACNIVKRVLMGVMGSVITKYNTLPLLGFIFTPWKYKIKSLNNIIKQFNRLCDWVLFTSYFREEIYGPCPKEIKKFVYLFSNYLGIDPTEGKLLGKILSVLIEADNAYRYRIEDIFSETTKEKLLANPRKEVLNLLSIYAKRQPNSENMVKKFALFAKPLSYSLLIPRIKKAFKQTIQEIDITKLQYDEADRYQVLIRDGYLYLGKTLEERYVEWVRVHNGKPPMPVQYKLDKPQ